NEPDDDISEDEKLESDSDYLFSGTESDDTSTDECISKEDDSTDSYVSDDDDINSNTQPDTIEKGGVTWSAQNNKSSGRFRATNILKKKSGSVTTVQTIFDVFKLFFTNDILDEIVLQTNKYAKRYFTEQHYMQLNARNHQTKLIKWRDLDRTKLEAFIGLLIQAGVGHNNHESITELWGISKNRPIFHATMPLRRFKQLSQHFIPSDNLTVDEQLVPFQGRCSFVQYMPTKPAKYGIKFWVLCDADSRYVLALELYTGKVGNVVQRNLATNVALRLIDQLPNNVKQGRNVTYDRYFSDYYLAKALLERKMTSLGVVDHKRSNTILSYQAKPKKPPIILLSTSHNFLEILDGKKKLPVMIHDYNQTKVGVDVVDQCINNYTVRRISRRWPMLVFFNMFDIAAINAMTIWLCQNPDWHSRKNHIRGLFFRTAQQINSKSS
ncbi:unnamed protein product, partial [Rotaria sp. Silwood2]